MVKSNHLTLRQPLQLQTANLEAIRNIPESSSTLLKDSSGRINALLSLVKYSPTHAYCFIAEVDEKNRGKFVNAEETEDPTTFIITEVKENVRDVRLLPIYVQVHHDMKHLLPIQHLVNHLCERTLGQTNLELKKNVTVDLCDDDDLDIWRDKAGFIVADRQKLMELSIRVSSFLTTLQPARNVQIKTLNEADMEKLHEFDRAISGLNRAKFLEYLVKNTTVLVAEGEGEEEGSIEGYIVTKRDRICALYANSKEIAHSLMETFLRNTKFIKIVLCTHHESWDIERDPSTVCHIIHRRHTRCVPAGIKWERVFVINCGVHIL